MHALDTIHRLNNQATRDQIPVLRARGQHVLVIQDGMHVVSVTGYATGEEAVAALNRDRLADHVGKSYTLYNPFDAEQAAAHAAAASGRDQSEDRTLGDYIARKQAAAGVDGEGSSTD